MTADFNGLPAGALVCRPSMLAAPPALPGLVIVLVGADAPVELIHESMTLNELGFDPGAAPVPMAAAEGFRADLAGCQAAIARLDGIGVAAGMYLPVRDGTSEIAGVATLSGYRRRGIGAAVTVALAEAAYARGADIVFLTTDNEEARSVYRRLGFTPVDHG